MHMLPGTEKQLVTPCQPQIATEKQRDFQIHDEITLSL